MSNALFPFVVEHQSDAELGDCVSHNLAQGLSSEGASDLYRLLKESPRVRWARWYEIGVEGNPDSLGLAWFPPRPGYVRVQWDDRKDPKTYLAEYIERAENER